MPKRWLGWIVLLVVLASGGPAFALTTNPASPIDVGNVNVGQLGTRMFVVEGQSPPQTLDHFDTTGANCVRFTLVHGALPVALNNGDTFQVTIEFRPLARGFVSCLVTMRDAINTNLGQFTISGTGVGAQLTLTVPNGPPVDFGSVRVLDAAVSGGTSTQTFTVSNTGDAGTSLTVNAPTFTGTNATNFAVLSPTFPQTIAAGGNIQLVVQFNPSNSGTRTATLNLSSNGGTATAGLTGIGTNARINVTSSSTFVGVAATATGTISVANNAAAPQGTLRVASAAISGGDNWFTFEDNGGGCAGAQTCTFNADITTSPLAVGIRCTPLAGATGTRTATFTFTSDSDTGGTASVALSCTGRADHTVDKTALMFAPQLVNTSSAPQTVTVTNVGMNIDLVFTVVKSPTGAPFSLAGCFASCVVPVGTSQSFTVTFTPTAANADATATLAIVDNDPDADSTVAVSGRGIAPQIAAPSPLDFGMVEVGDMGPQTLTVTNTGEATLTITNAVLSANAPYTVLTGTSGSQMTMVAPGQTTSWMLSCNPTVRGPNQATFTISSNAFSVPTAVVQLNCTGMQGVLGALGSIDFGNVPEMAMPADRTVTIRNDGNLTVSNIAAAINPASATYFSLVSLSTTTLTPGQSLTATVRYRPATGDDDGPVTLDFSGVWGATNKPIPPLAVPVLGNALKNGFDVAPSTIAVGDIRFDGFATARFCVQVTGQSEFDITMAQITPAAGTLTGEFTIASIKRNTVCAPSANPTVTLPQHIGPNVANSVLEFVVRVDPQDRVGPMAATITIVSNLPNMLSRTVSLTANSTTAMLAIDPASNIDFGPIDVQSSTSEMRRLTITNMGTAPLDLGNFVRTNVTGDPSTIAFTVPATQALAPNQSVVIDITFKPNIVEPIEVHLGHTIAGVFNGPSTGNIVIKGRGIDRTFMLLSDSETFPATFRNPGSMAPVKPITVRNLGEAPLAIQAAMLTTADPDVWQLVDTSSITIPGLGTHDFLVRFSPKAAGPTEPAVLELMHDDDMAVMTPIARVPLSGSGLDRDANFATEEIHLGYTGVGIPYRFDGIEILSMDPVNAFTIREIKYEENADIFLVDDVGGVRLDPSGAHTFGVTFSPTVAGETSTTIELFLDEDHVPQGRRVRLVGNAVFVDAHGGGGCSTSGGAGGGMLALVALGLVWRRRRRAAGATVVNRALVGLVGLVGLAGLVGLVGPAPARADNIVLSIFDPTPATTNLNSGFQVASPVVGSNGDWVASAVASYATDQFVHTAYLQDNVKFADHTAVKQSTLMLLGGAYALAGKYEFGARMPLYSQQGDAPGDRTMTYPGDPVAGTARGDLTLHAKMQLVRRQLEGKGLFALGPALHLTLPTATDDQFTGVDLPSVRGMMLMTLRPGAFDNRVTINVNAGLIGRAPARYASLEQKSGIAWGLGVTFRAFERVWLAGEMFGDAIPGGNQRSEDASMTVLSPIEWLVGARWLPDHRIAIGVAAGRGLNSSAGSPSLRGVLTLTFSPGAEKPTRLHIPPLDLDSDEDGLKDSADRCKFEPEDKDKYQDDDGCVDKDNDSDGLADAGDKCPMEAEDKDDFQDDDGCVDKDNDKDGVPDTSDKCKGYPEDKDGFEDVDGCPEIDNDRDGIVDAKDQCLNQPEAINGNKDDDGCPDDGMALVILSPDRIELLDTIKFNRGGAKIAQGSFNVLGQVAATLRAHPEIVRMRVTVHVHDTAGDGADKKDQELSDKRAQAVRDWIVQWGIPASRVESRGFGSTKMLGKTAQINERVELIILERK